MSGSAYGGRSKTSFLIDDILQAAPSPSPSPSPSSLQAWLPRPLPLYQPLCLQYQHLLDPSGALAEAYRGMTQYWGANYFSATRQSGLHSLHTKRKGGQVRFTSEQTAALERRFCGHKYLSPEERHVLARQLHLSDRQVKTWFQNRRAKWRRSNQLTPMASSSATRTEALSPVPSDFATSPGAREDDDLENDFSPTAE